MVRERKGLCVQRCASARVCGRKGVRTVSASVFERKGARKYSTSTPTPARVHKH